jgi:hypothetical protein
LNPWHPNTTVNETSDPTPLAQYYRVLREFTPAFYPGNVNLVLAQDQSRPLADCQNWWADKAKHLSTHIVPGDGNSYLRNHRDYLSQTVNTICHSGEPTENPQAQLL